MLASVLDEAEERRAVEHDRETMQDVGGEAEFVTFVQHDGVGAMVAAATAGDAVGAIGVGDSLERSERHGATLERGSGCGKGDGRVGPKVVGTFSESGWHLREGEALVERWLAPLVKRGLLRKWLAPFQKVVGT